MVKQITVNGAARTVVNTGSYGPGLEPHTYELKGGSWVYRIADKWYLGQPGQFKRQVEVGL
jgi:hypothetical protein